MAELFIYYTFTSFKSLLEISSYHDKLFGFKNLIMLNTSISTVRIIFISIILHKYIYCNMIVFVPCT